MPRVVVTLGAQQGLERCRQFLAGKNPIAARRAADEIRRQFRLLATQPEIGRPAFEDANHRELLITFGDSGYVARYHHLRSEGVVLILAFRHQKEAGY
ncbi:MAG: type II toxin-antitoxin system RelE/ParE family toxin [Inquilinus limosus]|uniref:Type II toxin-antitoxin system RelE/ParE family toxin n=1 Tax=Inquilinus limosus TaxID=171674 RepID=A0A952FQH9_9PROT|nr:type II toxin-antitoxin system RelE/ParE family toxin [Inquilinus limosus]